MSRVRPDTIFWAGALWMFFWVVPAIMMVSVVNHIEGWPVLGVLAGAILWTFAYPGSQIISQGCVNLLVKAEKLGRVTS